MVLTAGHCLEYFDKIEVGAYDKNDPDIETSIQIFSPVHKIRHPQFELSYFRYDFLLVKLDSTVEGIDPVVLNSSPQKPSGTSLLTIIGWGTTEESKNAVSTRTFPSVLQQAYVPYVPNKVCEYSEYEGNQSYLNEIFDEMLCAGRPGVDACKGDSGTPLMEERSMSTGADVQVGLVSWGRGCGKFPGVYARISHVYPWLRRQICWNSVNPPAYLNCQPWERSPASSITNTPSPSRSPSQSPHSIDKVNAGDDDSKASPPDDALDSDASDRLPPADVKEEPTPEFSWYADSVSASNRDGNSLLLVAFVVFANGLLIGVST